MPNDKQSDAPAPDAQASGGEQSGSGKGSAKPADAKPDNGGGRKPQIGDTRPAPTKAGGESKSDAGNGSGSDSSGSGGSGGGGRRRGRRGGRGRGRGGSGGGQSQGGDQQQKSSSQAGRSSGGTKGDAKADPKGESKSESRGSAKTDTKDRQAPSKASDDESGGEGGGRRRRRRRGRRGGRGRGQGTEQVKHTGRYLMCVHVKAGVATHVALLEGRQLVEHYVSRPQDDTTQIHGNIYWGKVQNVLPGMEAAFVDIGTPKNGVLYRGDVSYDENEFEGGRPKIERMLKNGQMVLVQVTKNPIGTKGARLTQELSLPGRYVVLVPDQPDTYGISKRLSDDERKRLRSILDDLRPKDAGLIVRTAAEGASAHELERDLHRLRSQWGEIKSKSKGRQAKLLQTEPDLALRMIREEFNKEYRGILIDDHNLYNQVRSYVEDVSPDLADRIELYEDPELDLFERYHVQEQLQKALDRKVWLPSGGSLVIEQTEALTVIDVNTSKNVGKSNLEETVYQNNLEAAEEVARQLRLRDIGGIIVIDFIDMEIEKNRNDVLRTFKDCLARDKTRTQVFDISELGLVEMTRKRVAEDLVESFSETCPTCSGRGIVLEEELL